MHGSLTHIMSPVKDRVRRINPLRAVRKKYGLELLYTVAAKKAQMKVCCSGSVRLEALGFCGLCSLFLLTFRLND